MSVKDGLITSLNEVRNLSSNLYQNTIPELTSESGIEVIATPLLQYPNLMNEFINVLVQKIAYTALETKLFNNPLRILEGDNIPLGTIGEEIYINPANGREYNVNDFAGLLEKYESDVKVQYQSINLDEQFPVTIVRQKLKQAFSTWGSLEDFIGNIVTSLYNGCYIRQYNVTKGLVANAYRQNAVQIQVLDAPNTEALAKAFVKQARTLFLNFQSPSTNYNAWNKVGGYGREIISWSIPDDIVFLIRNDIQSELDVEVMAKAFNITSTELMGKIIPVDNFNVYNRSNELVYDGSNILGLMADKSWFRIKEQDMYMEDFRNANNRSMQYYLNLIKMFKYSLFSNAVVFATEMPTVSTSAIEFKESSATVVAGEKVTLKITTTPVNSTDTITFTSSDSTKATVEKIDNRTVEVSGVAAGDVTITATAGNVTGTTTVTVNAGE